MKKMKAVQVNKSGDWEMVERDLVMPADNQVRIKVEACGVCGWPSGSAIDSEDTLKFCALTGIRPMIQQYPLDKAGDAFEDMMSNKARFRSVITMN